MTNQPFEGKEKILAEAIRLAKERRIAVEANENPSSSFAELNDYFNSAAYAPVREKKEALEKYLQSLEFHDVKALQALMYLGRDGDFDEADSHEERFGKIFQDLDKSGWEEKNIEIRQMTQKVPLDSYLINGVEIAGISI